jgi:putative transcriptional regulator
MDDEGIRNSLKVHRAMRNLTQADLAALAGVTRKSVNAIETGNMVPSVLLALKLSRALGVSIDTLFTLEGSATSAKLTWDPQITSSSNEGGSR